MNRRQRDNPSFSSSLLDEIYRSIDGGHDVKQEEMFIYTKKRTALKSGMKCNEPVTCHSLPVRDEKFVKERNVRGWSSSSSESSSGGFVENRPKPVRTNVPVRTEKSVKERNANNWSSSSSESSSGGFNDHRPKPVRTGLPVRMEKAKSPGNEKGFGKTKSRAMKIYGDFKKAKQPISPGGRLATFLNSIFTATTPKKAKISSSAKTSFDETNNPKPKSSCTSTCSSASSFSRSCLSNSSSREKPNNGAKRSVRFYPVSVILGQDEKDEIRNTINEEIKLRIMEKTRRVEEAARDLLKNYQKVEYELFNARDTQKQNAVFFNNDEDDDVDDDVASYASSDLFEIDHLSSIEDLPVYETTHFRKNLAIANGLLS